MSRTDKEVIQNLSSGTARHEETENRRNAFLGFFGGLSQINPRFYRGN
jgi:hypothetical protein